MPAFLTASEYGGRVKKAARGTRLLEGLWKLVDISWAAGEKRDEWEQRLKLFEKESEERALDRTQTREQNEEANKRQEMILLQKFMADKVTELRNVAVTGGQAAFTEAVSRINFEGIREQFSHLDKKFLASQLHTVESEVLLQNRKFAQAAKLDKEEPWILAAAQAYQIEDVKQPGVNVTALGEETIRSFAKRKLMALESRLGPLKKARDVAFLEKQAAIASKDSTLIYFTGKDFNAIQELLLAEQSLLDLFSGNAARRQKEKESFERYQAAEKEEAFWNQHDAGEPPLSKFAFDAGVGEPGPREEVRFPDPAEWWEKTGKPSKGGPVAPWSTSGAGPYGVPPVGPQKPGRSRREIPSQEWDEALSAFGK